MKYLLMLTLSAICAIGVADKLDDNIETLEMKVLWAHSEGEKYQARAEQATEMSDAELNLDKALKFFALEREYNTELCLYKLVSKIEDDIESIDWEESDDEESNSPDYCIQMKKPLSKLLG